MRLKKALVFFLKTFGILLGVSILSGYLLSVAVKRKEKTYLADKNSRNNHS